MPSTSLTTTGSVNLEGNGSLDPFLLSGNKIFNASTGVFEIITVKSFSSKLGICKARLLISLYSSRISLTSFCISFEIQVLMEAIWSGS